MILAQDLQNFEQLDNLAKEAPVNLFVTLGQSLKIFVSKSLFLYHRMLLTKPQHNPWFPQKMDCYPHMEHCENLNHILIYLHEHLWHLRAL